MVERARCHPDEEVVRALLEAQFDQTKNRFTSQVFYCPGGLSVSRLCILPIETILGIFQRDLEGPGRSRVLALGFIHVREILSIGRQHSQDLTVEADPLPQNLAHAVIPQRIESQRLRRELTCALRVKRTGDSDTGSVLVH